MNSLTNKLPNHSFDKTTFKHIEHLKLADPQFNITGDIDMLLGADVYSDIILEGLIKEKQTNIVAQQTQLGWVMCGTIKAFNCHVVINDTDLLTKFWETEELYQKEAEQNDDNICEQIYKQTTTRLEDGRYQVRLPMKPGFTEALGDSKAQAVAQFKQLEHKMEKNTEYANSYKQFIKEYIELNHMQITNNNTLGYFLPHHGVVKADSLTTKLRVVFNASATTKSGYSLNSLMHDTPNLQADLQNILIQWRRYQYVMTADIEKMYRFISIHPQDRPLQQIIWRDSPQKQLQQYQLCTVTYGTKAAPYLAIKTLKQLAADDGDKFPMAKPVLLNNFFVDDVLFGENTIEKSKQTRDELINLLKRGGFNLRKWSSNDRRLVEDLSENMRNPAYFDFTDSETSKTLGLGWKAQDDKFVFKSQLEEKILTTKRALLSDIAKLFDPLGWLSPVTVKNKILFQRVWVSKIKWDEELPENIKKEWITIRSDMDNIKNITIERWLGITSTNKQLELHAFCDASEKAYAAVVYSRVKTANGSIKVNIIAAKTKVAPLSKITSLPRLELCGALLLAKLVTKIKQSLTETNITIYGWTDSMVVLGWINGDVNRWKPYVANKVHEINNLSSKIIWQHIRTEQNPADCATRGLLPSQLARFSLWWQGPSCIHNSELIRENQIYNTDLEVRTRKTKAFVAQQTKQTITSELMHRYDSINKAARVLAWIYRFKAMTQKTNKTKLSKYLELSEIRQSLSMIIKQSQAERFDCEIKDLRRSKNISKGSNLLKLNPYLDDQGILRISGRLRNSTLDHEQKHPIIIPRNHRITDLLIDYYHKLTLHGGAKLTLSFIRQRYWVIGGNKTVKNRLLKCVACTKYKASKQYQLMGNLPRSRVTPSNPFENCGVDFAGPVEVKANKGKGIRTSKGYIAVFICMVTKAVHLELASDMSTQTFLAALKRLTARRGAPKNMYSDNGTNFVGANRELAKQFRENNTFSTDFFHKKMVDSEIQWHFNSPAWPSAGGLWERAVRSVKEHIRTTIGQHKLTFEEFTTLLCQIESCLNSRPLTTITEDADDLEYGLLTPGHFLIGKPLITLPEPDLTNEVTFKTRWQLVTKMKQEFWRKWSRDYLQELQARSKWYHKQQNINIGDVVVIKEDNLAPGNWAIAKVEEVHPGNDGLVRVITLRTPSGVIKRPIIKVIKLPVEQDESYEDMEGSKEDNKHEKNNTNKRSKTQTMKILSHYVYMLLCLLSLISESHSQYININQFENNRNIYYDDMGQLQSIRSNWKIITYYNMTTYWMGVNNVQMYIDHVDQLCARLSYQVLCNSINTELKQQFEQIEHNNYMITRTHKNRMKRGFFNGVGQLAHSLFGILDETFAEQYRQDINDLNTNEQHLLLLIKNQTTLVEAQNNILQRNEDSMNKQFELMNKHLTNAEEQINTIAKQFEDNAIMMYFTTIAFTTNMILNKLKYIQEEILNYITDLNEGKVHHQLISQEQLLEQLSIVSTQLPAHLSLPVEDIKADLATIYKLLHVKARITEMYFIFEIKIPLLDDKVYNLYKIIPIPTIHNRDSTEIIPRNNYIAVNMMNDIYIEIEHEDLRSCVELQHNKRICTFNKPVKIMNRDDNPCEIRHLVPNMVEKHKCATKTEQCTNRWTELNKHNTWFFVCCQECELRIICKNHVIGKTVNRTGTISLDNECSLKETNTIIHTNNEYQRKVYINPKLKSDIIDDINNIVKLTNITYFMKNTTFENVSMSENHTVALGEIKQKLNILQEQSELPKTISDHDIHQYAVSYVALSAFLILTTLICVYFYCNRRKPETATYNVEEIELKAAPSKPKRLFREPNSYAIPKKQFSI